MPFVNRIPARTILSEFRQTELSAGYDPETNMWEVIIKFNGDIFRVGQELGIEIELLSENYAIATLTLDQISLLVPYTEIEHIESPKILALNLHEELHRSCVDEVHSSSEFNLLGQGVLIAILDSGIDYTHPDFINEDRTSRILYLWDQTAVGAPPEGFKRGVEYNNNQLNEALLAPDPYAVVPQTDIVGHGTAIAGIAAGNGREAGGETGVAPEASLIIVKLGEKGFPSFAKTTELMRAIKYVIDKAQMLNMPVVINISYGTNDGPHNGQSIFETYIDSMAERWKNSIVVAAGNEGSAGHHHEGKIASHETQEVDFFYAGKFNSFYITLWKNFTDDFTVELTLPGGQTTGEIIYYDLTRTYRFGNISVFVNYGQPQFYNAFQEIFFQISSPPGPLPIGIYKITVRARQITDGNYNMYLPTVEEVTAQTAFTISNENITLTIPATAQNVITVGGYDSERGIIASFSGKGNTLNVVFAKPDLVAPAVNTSTAKVGGGYGFFTGTSMAAPFVTGSVALMMQWGIVQGNDPFLYGERVKSYLKSGATRRPDISYPNNSWGYGTLCLFNTMLQLRSFTRNI